MIFAKLPLVALSLLSASVLTQAAVSNKLTNAERLRRHQPPLPPRSLYDPTRVSTAAKAKRSNYPNVYLEFNCGGDDDNEYDEAHCCASVGWISTTNTYHSDGFTDCTAGTDHYSTCDDSHPIPVCCDQTKENDDGNHWAHCTTGYQSTFYCPSGGLNGNGRNNAGCCDNMTSLGFSGCNTGSDDHTQCDVGQYRTCCGASTGTNHENCDGFGVVTSDDD